MNSKDNHISYFDLLRGIAILFVIINHSYSGNPLAGTIKEDFYLLIRQIVIPAVPIFLAESGYFLEQKVIQTKRDYFSFVFNHSFRIYLPMIIWSIPLFIFTNHHGHHIFFTFYLLIGGYSIYYFIALIIQYYVVQPMLRKVNLGGVVLSLIITCIATSVICYYTAIQGRTMPLIVAVGLFPVWLVYPVLGYFIRKIGTNYKLWPWLTISVIGLLTCFVETKILYVLHSSGIGATKVSAIVLSCGIIMLLFNDKTRHFFDKFSKSIIYRIVEYVGEISFGVYLIHKYFLDFLVAKIVDDTFIRALLTLILSVAFIALVKLFIPQFANKYLGFK